MDAPDIEAMMRHSIVRGEFMPDSWLRMEDLKARFSVGFSPIREALSRLVGEGLIDFEPNKGFRVKGLSQADLEDISITRVAVETTALALAIERGDDRWEAGVVGALHHYRRKAENAFATEETLQAWEKAHDELHVALISACKSERLLTLQKRLQDQHLRYRRLIVIPQVSQEAHVEEHEMLVDLALSRKTEEAVEQIARHMRITVETLSAAGLWNETE